MKRLILAALALALSTGLGHAQDKQFFRIGTGTAGTFPVFAAKMAEIINANVPAVQATVSGGGVEGNQIKLQNDELEANMIYTWNSALLFDADNDYGLAVDKARHVWSMGDAYFQPVVQKSVEITDLKEIADHPFRTWVGPKSFSLETVIRKALESVGVTEDVANAAGGVLETTPFASLPDQFADRQLDVAFFIGPIPFGPMLQIENNPGFRMIGMSSEQIAALAEMLPGIFEGELPANTYAGQDEPVKVARAKTHIVLSADVDEEIAYEITKALNENYKQFHGLYGGSENIDPARALEGNTIPIHPGAERYYREVGLLK